MSIRGISGAVHDAAAAFQAHPEWAVLFGDYIFIDGEGRGISPREEACWDPQSLRFGFNYLNHRALFVRKATYNRLSLLRHKDFMTCCDHKFLMRVASANSQVDHIRKYITPCRLHQYGKSADRRIVRNMAKETARIQQECGRPGGLLRKLLRYYARSKRQMHKAPVPRQVRFGGGLVA